MGRPARHKAVTADDVRRDYTPLAPIYEERWRHFNAAVRNWILARWPDNLWAGARVLDLGCGTGAFLDALRVHHPRLSCVGVDITPALLARAREIVPAATLIQGDAEDPPLSADSFDVVCSLNVLHHLNDPAAHIAALARLCRPGGTVFVCTFAGGATLAMRLADLWLRLRNPAWRGMLSAAELTEMLRHEPRLALGEDAILRAGPFWRLQIYRLSVEPPG